MTRILVQRGSAGSSSSSNQSRPVASASAPASAPSSSSSTPAPAQLQATINNNNQNQVVSAQKDELAEEGQERSVMDDSLVYFGPLEGKGVNNDDLSPESLDSDLNDEKEKAVENEVLPKDDFKGSGDLLKDFGGLSVVEEEIEGSVGSSLQMLTESSYPPPPPVPPPRPSSMNSNIRRSASGTSSPVRIGSSRRATGWSTVSTRTSPTGSRPSSPRSHGESEGYNSADEQSPFGSSYDDAEREQQFEMDLRRVKGLEVKKMLEDGNCLFRAVADQVYGDSEAYDLVRQMCIDYMERERDHFSQFITEGFTSYCKRKRRDKVYGNNVEIQALSEMYNRPIQIYPYSTEPINTFHRYYDTDTPPIRLSYHHGNHYNSLVDPRTLTIGAGLGFSSLRGTNVDRDQVKAAIKAQQDQQIDNALLAEGRFYSDLELTEKEIERMVIEASRVEYLANDNYRQQLGYKESSTSGAEPSSSGVGSIRETKKEGGHDSSSPDCVLSSSMQIVLSMGFSYLQAIEAYSIFGDDVDSMVCYLLETSSSSRRKGKATE